MSEPTLTTDPPALVTPEALSAATGGRISSADPRVPVLIDGATRAVRRYCGWHVAPEWRTTLTLDAPGGWLLALPTLRLGDVHAFTFEDAPLALTDVEWSHNGEVRKLNGPWGYGYRSITADVTHGYTLAADLATVIAQVVVNALASPLGATREQAGSMSVQWATTAPGVSGGVSLLERDLALLNTYKLPGRL